MSKPVQQVSTIGGFDRWLRGADRGDRAIYFIGTWLFNAYGVRNDMGDFAYGAFKKGKALLFQKFVGLQKGVPQYAYTVCRI